MTHDEARKFLASINFIPGTSKTHRGMEFATRSAIKMACHVLANVVEFAVEEIEKKPDHKPRTEADMVSDLPPEKEVKPSTKPKVKKGA